MTLRQKHARTATKRINRDVDVPTDILPMIREWLNALPESPKNDWLRANVFSKFVGPETAPSALREELAIQKWLVQETNNRHTNDRWHYMGDDVFELSFVPSHRFIEWVRNYIAKIIGDTVPVEALLMGEFSSGASTSRKKQHGHPAKKLVGIADVSTNARTWFDLYLSESPGLSSSSEMGESRFWDGWGKQTREVSEAILFTVPKNSEIDRCACKEPDVNMLLQKGAGQYIRRRLRKFGVNLNDQQYNQYYAWEGSEFGDLATLDLSSASDSITTEVVMSLMPTCWWSFLNDIRSTKVSVPSVGEAIKTEMFSSMGNGFTFELETLIFFALAKATCYFTGTKGIVSVYGDDLIVPIDAAEPFVEVLSCCGFQVNDDKSFVSGPFRESCGKHFHNGTDVTPFFIRKPITRLSDLIHFLNSLRVWACQDQKLFADSSAWELWSTLKGYVPPEFWGGDVLSAGKFQLVSPDRPQSRLSPYKEKVKLPAAGRYRAWLMRNRGRPDRVVRGVVLPPREVLVDHYEVTPYGDPQVSVFSTCPRIRRDAAFEYDVLTDCRVKPAKVWGWHSVGMIFLEEL